MAELLAQLRRRERRGDAVGVHRRAVERRGRERDPSGPGAVSTCSQVRPLGRRRGVGVARRAPRRGVEHGRAVAHAARHHVLDRAAGQALAGVGRRGITRARNLEPEQAAARGRDPDRAAAVAGMGDRHQARRDRRRRAAARAAGRARQVPGIAGRPEQHRLGRGAEAELRRVGAAEDHQAGALVADHDLGVDRGARVGEEARARRQRHSGLGAAEVLEQERHAGQRRRAVVAFGGRARLIVDPRDHGIEGRVQRLDALDRRLEHLRGRDLAAPHQLGDAERVVLGIFLERPHASSLPHQR